MVHTQSKGYRMVPGKTWVSENLAFEVSESRAR